MAKLSARQFDDLGGRYQAEFPRYQRLAVKVEALLRQRILDEGVECNVSSRTKTVISLVKKALIKGYAHPLDQITDKAGVRVVAPCLSDIRRIEPIVESVLIKREVIHKRDGLAPNELGYLGTHFLVQVPPSELGIEDSDLQDLCAELQLHTGAEDLWSTVTHGRLYKPDQALPDEGQRSLYRLMALVELFDGELDRAQNMLDGRRSYSADSIMTRLETIFLRLQPAVGKRSIDRELSRYLLSCLAVLIPVPGVDTYLSELEGFVDSHESKLRGILEAYAEDLRNPVLGQPEILFIFHQLVVQPARLTELWAERLPYDLLVSLSTIWGTPIVSTPS